MLTCIERNHYVFHVQGLIPIFFMGSWAGQATLRNKNSSVPWGEIASEFFWLAPSMVKGPYST